MKGLFLNRNAETIYLDSPKPKRKKLTDKLTEKIAVSDKSMDIFIRKPEEHTEADVDVFETMFAVK